MAEGGYGYGYTPNDGDDGKTMATTNKKSWKCVLQETNPRVLPTYMTRRVPGTPDHAPQFDAAVDYVTPTGVSMRALGRGSTKTAAEEHAAHVALKKIKTAAVTTTMAVGDGDVGQLRELCERILRHGPTTGMLCKEIRSELRSRFGTKVASKPVNSVLYRSTDVFAHNGDQPPRFWLRAQGGKAVTATTGSDEVDADAGDSKRDSSAPAGSSSSSSSSHQATTTTLGDWLRQTPAGMFVPLLLDADTIPIDQLQLLPVLLAPIVFSTTLGPTPSRTTRRKALDMLAVLCAHRDVRTQPVAVVLCGDAELCDDMQAALARATRGGDKTTERPPVVFFQASISTLLAATSLPLRD